MTDVLQSMDSPCKVGLALSGVLAIAGAKATYETYKKQSKQQTSWQLVALSAAVVHCVLNMFETVSDLSFLGQGQSLACFVGSVLVGLMEYNLLEESQDGLLFLACSAVRCALFGFVDSDKWVTLEAMFFGLIFFATTHRQSRLLNDILASHAIALFAFSFADIAGQPRIGYILPTLICAYRANHYQIDEPANKGIKDEEVVRLEDAAVLDNESDISPPSKVDRPKVEQPKLAASMQAKVEPEEDVVDKMDQPVDREEQTLPEEPSLPSKPELSFEDRMRSKIKEMRKRSMQAELEKAEMSKEEHNEELDRLRGLTNYKCKAGRQKGERRRSRTKDGKSSGIAPSGDMNSPADQDNVKAKTMSDERTKAVKDDRARQEAYNNKMDEAHQAMNSTQQAQESPVIRPTKLHKVKAKNSMQLQFDWDKSRGTTLKKKRKRHSGGGMSDMDKLKKMKQRREEKKIEKLHRESNTPGLITPTIGKADEAADNKALKIAKATKAIGGILGKDVMEPSLNRAVATPDQDALQHPETAKGSSGIIHVRAEVLYSQMEAMMKGPEMEITSLTAQLKCCKKIIRRLKTEIKERKRAAGLQRTMHFMERHSLLQEHRLERGETGETGEIPESLTGSWTVMHYDGDFDLTLDEEEDGMLCGDAREFMENVSGKYNKQNRSFCIRVDTGPCVFQLLQGEMVGDFGIVMLKGFNNGAELPTEFCIMLKDTNRSQIVGGVSEDATSDEGDDDVFELPAEALAPTVEALAPTVEAPSADTTSQ